jgi:hypothetical protein
MMSFQKLLFNIFVALVSSSCFGEIIVRWAEPTPIKNGSYGSDMFYFHKVNGPMGKKIFPDPSKIKTLLDVQEAWVHWAKNTNINISVKNSAAHIFLKEKIWFLQQSGSPTDSSPFFIDHLMNPLTIEGIHYKKRYAGGFMEKDFIRDNRLKASEDEFAGEYISDPLNPLNPAANYYDMRFFESDWIPFWKEMEKKSKAQGYKSLDGACIDMYSKWCKEKYGTPFYMHLQPSEMHHHVKFFKRSFYREFQTLSATHVSTKAGMHDPREMKSLPITRYVNKSGPSSKSDSWAHEWDYINFAVKWMLVFEVWKDKSYTREIRGNWVHNLAAVRKDGWPYRVSFKFSGSLWGFIDRSIQEYNGKNAKCFIGARFYGHGRGGREPQIFLHL